MSFSSPLPNIIMLGDFNLPNMDRSFPTINYHIISPLTGLTCLLFLNQQIKEPTRKLNIFDLIFCHAGLVNMTTTTDTFLADHHIINVSTCTAIPQSIFHKPKLKPLKKCLREVGRNMTTIMYIICIQKAWQEEKNYQV